MPGTLPWSLVTVFRANPGSEFVVANTLAKNVYQEAVWPISKECLSEGIIKAISENPKMLADQKTHFCKPVIFNHFFL